MSETSEMVKKLNRMWQAGHTRGREEQRVADDAAYRALNAMERLSFCAWCGLHLLDDARLHIASCEAAPYHEELAFARKVRLALLAAKAGPDVTLDDTLARLVATAKAKRRPK